MLRKLRSQTLSASNCSGIFHARDQKHTGPTCLNISIQGTGCSVRFFSKKTGLDVQYGFPARLEDRSGCSVRFSSKTGRQDWMFSAVFQHDWKTGFDVQCGFPARLEDRSGCSMRFSSKTGRQDWMFSAVSLQNWKTGRLEVQRGFSAQSISVKPWLNQHR